MPAPDQTGYILVSLAAKDDDTPVRDPAKVAEEIAGLGVEGVVSTDTVYNDGFGHYVRYGVTYLA